MVQVWLLVALDNIQVENNTGRTWSLDPIERSLKISKESLARLVIGVLCSGTMYGQIRMGTDLSRFMVTS